MTGAYAKQIFDRRYRHFQPKLAEAIARKVAGKTVSDFGCGLGLYVAFLRAYGLHAVGYDGAPDAVEKAQGNVELVDLTEPLDLPITQAAISIEVGEHIPPELTCYYVDNVCQHATELLIISWAWRNQLGRDHVNCLDPDEVIELFHAERWYIQPNETRIFRQRCPRPFHRKALIFRRDPDGFEPGKDRAVIDQFKRKNFKPR